MKKEPQESRITAVSNEKNSVKLGIAMGKNRGAHLKEKSEQRRAITGKITKKTKPKSLKSKLVNFVQPNMASQPRTEKPQNAMASCTNSIDMSEELYSLQSPGTMSNKIGIINRNGKFANSTLENNVGNCPLLNKEKS